MAALTSQLAPMPLTSAAVNVSEHFLTAMAAAKAAHGAAAMAVNDDAAALKGREKKTEVKR